jgi:predicted RNA binding protein YcfA (HicA-like mRNA interferase family)
VKLPRDLTGPEVIKGLRRLGYELDRQSGSHMILRCQLPQIHSITVPNHKPIKVGTLSAILHEIASQRRATVDEVLAAMKL